VQLVKPFHYRGHFGLENGYTGPENTFPAFCDAGRVKDEASVACGLAVYRGKLLVGRLRPATGVESMSLVTSEVPPAT